MQPTLNMRELLYLHVDLATQEAWVRYGLCLQYCPVDHDAFRAVAAKHTAVARYLDAHPDVAAQYRPDQSGAIKYFDVLTLAAGHASSCREPEGRSPRCL